MASFNYLKEWEATIGDLRINQVAQPIGDGDQLHVITGWRANGLYFNHSSRLPFADVEKLLDDGFRMELARAHVAERAKELREAAEFAEKALAVEHEQVVRREVLHDEAMGRHTP